MFSIACWRQKEGHTQTIDILSIATCWRIKEKGQTDS